ncbi:MAG: hypothetical protein ACK5QX_12295 [bacterium]|jgi:hypothetical protein
MSRFSRKAPANTASPSFDPFTQPNAKAEISEYTAMSGNTFAAVSVADMLKACGIAAPHGVYFPATRQGEEPVMLIRNPPAQKAQKASPTSAAPVMAQPLATISPDKLLAAMISRLSQEQIAALTGQPAVASQAPAKAMRRKAS